MRLDLSVKQDRSEKLIPHAQLIKNIIISYLNFIPAFSRRLASLYQKFIHLPVCA
jgi:hypothetical protein